MPSPKGPFAALRERTPWQLFVGYVFGSWIVLQIAETLSSLIGLPAWFGRGVLILLAIGLPIITVTAALQSRLSRADRPEGPPRGSPLRLLTWRNSLFAGLVAFALFGLGTGAYMALRSLGIGPAGTLIAKGILEDRSPVLLAELESPTGDSLLARAATEALRVDLAQSGAIRLVDERRVAQALERMGREAGEPITFETAQEIAIRDGIPIVIAGEVNSLGGGFVMSARVVGAADGETLLSHRETARDSASVLDALEDLSRTLRERIGESLKSTQSSAPLAEVTTPSLEALRLYSEAVTAINVQREIRRGITLLEEAVARDSAFAMAWRKMGLEKNNRGWPRSEVVTALTEAYEHRERLTDRERYLAEAAYFSMTGELDRAEAAYLNIISRWPDASRARNNLAFQYRNAGELEKAVAMFREAIAADTLNTYPQGNLLGLQIQMGDLDGALETNEAYARRFPHLTLQVGLARGQVAAARGDYAEAESIFLKMAELSPNIGTSRIESVIAVQGRLVEADEVSRQAGRRLEADGAPSGFRSLDRAGRALFLRERPAEAIRIIDETLSANPLGSLDPIDRPYARLAGLLAAAGAVDRARVLMREFERDVPADLRRTVADAVYRARGEIALAEGRHGGAIDQFLLGQGGQCPERCPRLATAYDLAGRADSAIALYERYVSHTGGRGGYFEDQFFRAPFLERLGQLHEEAGDLEKAALFYARFVELWADADPELQPRVQAAQARLQAIADIRG